MFLCVIVAATPNGGLGTWDLPWHRRWVREWTRGDTVIMEYDMWTRSGPLPETHTIVISPAGVSGARNGCTVSTMSEAIARARTEPMWIVGGARMIESALDNVDMVVLTTVYGPYERDATAPSLGNLGKAGFRCAWSSRLFSGDRGRFRYRIFTRVRQV